MMKSNTRIYYEQPATKVRPASYSVRRRLAC